MLIRVLVTILMLAFSSPSFAGLPALVDSITPAQGATDVSTNPTFVIKFKTGNDGIDCSTVVADGSPNIYVTSSSSSGNVSTRLGKTSFECVSGEDQITMKVIGLASATDYKLFFSRDLQMSNGLYLVGGFENPGSYSYYTDTFKTGTSIEPPIVVSTSPMHNATEVPVNSAVIVSFDKEMDASTLNASNITFKKDSQPVGFTVQYAYVAETESSDLLLTPTSNLALESDYTVIIKKEVKSSDGSSLEENYEFVFKTIPSDNIKPTVIGHNPVNNATSVPINITPTVTFSEPMWESTVTNPSNIQLKQGSTVISGDLSYLPGTNTVTFTPSSPLEHEKQYTFTVEGVMDLAGNHIDKKYSWPFTTVGNKTVTSVDLNDYCQIPPFITSGANSLKPNVLLIFDNSGSMSEFAYKASGKGNSTSARDSSYNPNTDYYGLFESGRMYKYNSAGYFELDLSTALNKTSMFSGNMLNWLTTRRVDLVKKVLVGGQATTVGQKTPIRSTSGPYYVYPYSKPDRDYYKSYGGKNYNVTTTLKACATTNCNTSSDKIYQLKVLHGNIEPKGLLHNSYDKVNFGIEFFNYGSKYEDGSSNLEGGFVKTFIPVYNKESTESQMLDHLKSLVSAVESSDADPQNWTPLAESFYEATRYFRAQQSAYNNNVDYKNNDPISVHCMQNFVILLTDGVSTKDRNVPGTGYSGASRQAKIEELNDGIAKVKFNVKDWIDFIDKKERSELGIGSSTLYTHNLGSGGSWYLPAVAFWAHTTDLRTDRHGLQNLTTYVVYTMDNDNNARNILKLTAKYGGFDDSMLTHSNTEVGRYWPDHPSKWDVNSDGLPDNYYEAQNGQELVTALNDAIEDIIAKVSSGTSASIVSNRGESGSNIFQAMFFPKRTVGNAELIWTGELNNMWYYLDPNLMASSIREDTNVDGKLDLKEDYMVSLDFDPASNQTLANWYKDTTGRGDFVLADDKVQGPIENINAIWRAGRLLHKRSPNTRTIFTALTPTVSGGDLIDFTVDNAGDLRAHLNHADIPTAKKTIDYIRGVDYINDSNYRSRTTTLNGTTATWKLGTIVSSTPQAQTQKQLQNYDGAYRDDSYKRFYSSSNYQKRNMLYTGGNDGMLHAYKIGSIKKIKHDKSKPYRVAEIENVGTLDVGDEKWAFIPNSTLPYLKYYSDANYNHLYYVDGQITLLDLSINKTSDDVSCSSEYWNCDKDENSWRTILVGSMGLGGASKYYGEFCNKPDGSQASKTSEESADCVKSPVVGTGLSSFFALDVTDPEDPKYMWEFPGDTAAAGKMGFAVSGPAIVRVAAKQLDKDNKPTDRPNHQKNGRWFGVFASGPTGPIDTGTHTFKGYSDQQLRIFIVDLATGELVRTIEKFEGGASLPMHAFGGSLSTSWIDVDRDKPFANGFYSDDAVYISYSYKESGKNWETGTKGGVIRISTNESTDPNDWKVSKLIDGIGPVTTSVSKLLDARNKNLWVYIGTGRYYDKDDDQNVQQALYGIKDPCYKNNGKFDGTCTLSVNSGNLANQTDNPTASIETEKAGWIVKLDGAEKNYNAERVITDPVASTSGAVMFTTLKPSNDICSFGGNTFIWALNYASGGAPPSSAMQGKALIQVSTGSIASVNMKQDFSNPGSTRYDMRRTSTPITGVPPASQGLSLLAYPPPAKKFIHVREK